MPSGSILLIKSVQKLIDAGKYPATVSATMDRVEALRDADVVLTTILTGSTEVWRHDIEIPKKYGVDINVGDTRGPSGIFRFLRTLTPMMDIVRDMERYCPGATLLNYTNPMAMLCGALQRQTFIPVTGLCHSVQGTAMMLAYWIGAEYENIDYLCAGINHQAFYLKFEEKGVDLYPRIHKAVTEDPEIYNEELVRNEMYLALGYYVTESSGHNSEYNWWFRKRPDLIEKYCIHGTGWNPGEYAYILKEYQKTETSWKNDVRVELAKEIYGTDLDRGQEYAAYIINALKGGEPLKLTGTCPTPSWSPTCRKEHVWRCRCWQTAVASTPCTWVLYHPSARCWQAFPAGSKSWPSRERSPATRWQSTTPSAWIHFQRQCSHWQRSAR